MNIEEKMMSLLSLLHGLITKDAEDELKELITHSECGLAYEDICSVISSCKIPISSSDFNQIVEAGKLMKYDQKTWSMLKDLIV